MGESPVTENSVYCPYAYHIYESMHVFMDVRGDTFTPEACTRLQVYNNAL